MGFRLTPLVLIGIAGAHALLVSVVLTHFNGTIADIHRASFLAGAHGSGVAVIGSLGNVTLSSKGALVIGIAAAIARFGFTLDVHVDISAAPLVNVTISVVCNTIIVSVHSEAFIGFDLGFTISPTSNVLETQLSSGSSHAASLPITGGIKTLARELSALATKGAVVFGLALGVLTHEGDAPEVSSVPTVAQVNTIADLLVLTKLGHGRGVAAIGDPIGSTLLSGVLDAKTRTVPEGRKGVLMLNLVMGGIGEVRVKVGCFGIRQACKGRQREKRNCDDEQFLHNKSPFYRFELCDFIILNNALYYLPLPK